MWKRDFRVSEVPQKLSDKLESAVWVIHGAKINVVSSCHLH